MFTFFFNETADNLVYVVYVLGIMLHRKGSVCLIILTFFFLTQNKFEIVSIV